MRLLSAILFISILGWGPVWAAATSNPKPNQGIFTSVEGKVKIRSAKGNASRQAKKDSTVVEGERVVTDDKSSATLRLFDGSDLKISPQTDFRLAKIQQLPGMDKVMEFKLFVGKLLAKVTKLASSKSSFEIEAGGVVCGVRGTEYSMFFDPNTGKVDVLVLDGTVWAASGGQTQVFHQGQGGSFMNGQWDLLKPPAAAAPTQGFISSNPFYGFNGNATDDFNHPLTDLPGGVGGVAGQVGDDGIAGLGSHTLILRLGFPQYLP